MDPKRNFKDFYQIESPLSIGKKAARSSNSAMEGALLAMEGASEHGRYMVKRTENPRAIVFGRFSEGAISPNSRDLLILSANYLGEALEELPAVALRYGIYPQEFVIGYVQTHALLDSIEPYKKMKKDLGNARPHEFLVAQFLARVAKTLDKHPSTGVFVAQHYTDKPVYPRLRDRFFDDHYSLNPNRERVRQILGKDNSWLHPDAIESRKGRLEELMESRKRIRRGTARKARFGWLLGEEDVELNPLGNNWPELFV